MRRLTTAFATAFSIMALTAPNALAADRLPDLGVGRLGNISVQRTSDGHRLLRFDVIAANVGQGPFEVRGSRSSTTQVSMGVTQRVYDTTGGFRDIATPANMQFEVGDGHTHWHVIDFEDFALLGLTGRRVATGAKRGYCFYDNYRYRMTLPGAPGSPVYRGCGTASALDVVTGISVGWGDIYQASLAYQYIDITNLPTGKYRLMVTADPSGWFVESNEANNYTWVDLSIKRNRSARVVGYGPVA